MHIEKQLAEEAVQAVTKLYGVEPDNALISVQKTRPEIAGDYTIVMFPLLRISKKNPVQTAEDMGAWLVQHSEVCADFKVIKGFLNLTLKADYWKHFFTEAMAAIHYGMALRKEVPPVVVEYSSPNTNKPLHLGHIRNNLLGYSVAKIMEANGYPVVKVNLVNDRGIHICKSMLAWQKFGDGETPESSGMKGDHLIGKYYVCFDKAYKQEVATLMQEGMTEEEAKEKAPLMQEARSMLRKWEAQDPETLALWKKMNGWVYEGFDITYQRMGVSFDKIYYESETYLLGKELVMKGLEEGRLLQKEDSSVWADLTSQGLDEKILLRSDGTSVYMTQDLGTANLRYNDYHPQKMVYVVGNEQNYHFEVLARVLKMLGKTWSDTVYHLSYGMVELPDGKMKSREGTVVDADDLMDGMYDTAKAMGEALGKVKEGDEEAADLYQMVSLGALKYFILKVDPKKKILFNPAESIDFNGNTGPFIQYTYARICSLLRKAREQQKRVDLHGEEDFSLLQEGEMGVLKMLHEYPMVVESAGEHLSPAMIANYAYDLAKAFNGFYQEVPVLKEEDEDKTALRLSLALMTGRVIKSAMALLGIEVPERM
ncbi:MAG: arginine--tRNA ligase [Bacteroidetes bacterium]|nr:MAG: arginine--tRNA ligase [Bacteroidota bacterium]